MKLVIIWVLITVFFSFQLAKLKVDFEFEKFFPTDDPDITFYESHLEKFGYDNDYLLIILENSNGIFNTTFLQNSQFIEDSLDHIPVITKVINPVSFKHLVQGPMGVTPLPLIHIKDSKKFKSDSVRIFGNPLYASFFSQDGHSLMIQVVHEHLEDPEIAHQLIEQIKSILVPFEFDNYRIVGKLTAQNEFVSFIKKDFSLFLIIALIVSFILLSVLLKSIKIALLPFLISVTALIWLLGLMAFLGFPITVLGSLIPPVILFVSSSDAIHLINAYRNTDSEDFSTRLNASVHKVWIPTLLTSVTTAIGFFSLLAVNTEPIQNLGLFVGIGVLMAFVITFAFGPLLISKNYPSIQTSRVSKIIPVLIIKNSKLIFGSSLIIIILSTYGLSKLEVDAYLLDDLPKSNHIRTDFEFVDEHFGGSKPWELAYWPSDSTKDLWDENVMQEANKIHTYLINQYPIGRLWSPVSLISYGRQMVGGGLNSNFKYPDDQYYRSLQAISQLSQRNELPALLSKNDQYGRFAGFLPEYGSKATIQKDQKLKVYLKDTIDSSILSYRLTGTTYLIDKSHNLLSINLFKGLAIGIGSIAILLGIYFRSVKILLLSLIPNIIPLLVTAGYMGIGNISLKLTTSIIFVIAFGIAVDDTIHFISVYRTQNGTNRVMNLIRTFRSAGTAIIITSVIIVAGFSLFIFSSFGATHYLGLFLSLSLTSAVLIDLTLLPLLLHLSDNKIRE